MSGIRALVGSLFALFGLSAFAASVTGIAWADRIGAGKAVGSKTLDSCVKDCSLHTVFQNGNHVLAWGVGISCVMLMIVSLLACVFAVAILADNRY